MHFHFSKNHNLHHLKTRHSLRSITDTSFENNMSQINITEIIFTLFGFSILFYLIMTLQAYPLFPFQMSNIDWTREWLIMTVLDYYGSTACFSVIVLFSEPLFYAIPWILSFNLLGSPFCCAYIVYRLYMYRTLSLSDCRSISHYERASLQ